MGKLKQYNRAVELLAVAAEDTAGPLKVEPGGGCKRAVIFGTKSVSGRQEALVNYTTTKPLAPKPNFPNKPCAQALP